MLARNYSGRRFLDSLRSLEMTRETLIDIRLFYWFEISVRFVWVEDFVAVHYCDEVFGVGEVDDVVGIARKHVDCFYLISAYFKVEDCIRSYSALLDKPVTADYDEKFPLGIVPVLTFGDTWFADVDRYLATVECVDELGE